MSCDVLVFAPHPDDAEIHLGATIAAQVRAGASVVIADATRGELGSRGSAEQRASEAAAAAAILGVRRENLGLPDGGLSAGALEQRRSIVDCLRRHRAGTVLCLGGHARHPDHIALAALVRDAVKTAALHAYATPSGAPAFAGAPALAGAGGSGAGTGTGVRLWFAEAELPVLPQFLVACSEADWDAKRRAILAYSSQLHRPDAHGQDTGLPTTIATPAFLTWIEHRGRTWGYHAGAAYGEAFTGPEVPRLGDLRGV